MFIELRLLLLMMSNTFAELIISSIIGNSEKFKRNEKIMNFKLIERKSISAVDLLDNPVFVVVYCT